MMTKQQKPVNLGVLVKNSGIEQSIKVLNSALENYERLPYVDESRYVIYLELGYLKAEINQLEQTLKYLKSLSKSWE